MIEIKRAKRKGTRTLVLLLLLLAAVIALMILLPGCSSTQSKIDEATLVHEGDQAPDFEVTMLGGERLDLSSLRGKVVLLNFWATWCPPCRQELARVQQDVIDRFAGRDFVFLPVSRGEQPEEVARFIEAQGYTFPVGLDPRQEIYGLYATNYIPRNFLIDDRGRVVVATVGYEPAEFDQLVQTIARTLDKSDKR